MMSRKQIPDTREDGTLLMTKRNVLQICEEEGLYEYAELNSKLYLNSKSFSKLENLDSFINVTSIFLENNLIEKIENLESLPNLTHLFIQNNLIKKLEGLENNKKLIVLNVARNQINQIENLGGCESLKNLDISFNYIKSSEAMSGILEMPALSTLDLQSNHLEYDDNILPTLQKVPTLLVLYLLNNPCQRHFKSYRKQLIGNMPNITYLDDRPTSQEELRLSQSWVVGGIEELRNEREKMKDEYQEKRKQEIQQTKMNSYKKKKMKINYLKAQLKNSILEQSKLLKFVNESFAKQERDAEAYYKRCLEEETQRQYDIQESIENMKKQVKKLKETQDCTEQEQEFQQMEQKIKIDMKDSEIQLILQGLVNKHFIGQQQQQLDQEDINNNNENKILENFKEMIKGIYEHLDFEMVGLNYEEISKQVKKMMEEYQQQQCNKSDTDSFSGKGHNNSSSLQEYNDSNSQPSFDSQSITSISSKQDENDSDDQNNQKNQQKAEDNLDELD